METREILLGIEARFCLKLIQDMANMDSMPKDLVKRAMEITKLTFEALKKEDWIQTMKEDK